MQLEEHADAAAFLEAAAPVLGADEARHNLIYGICSTLVDAPHAYPEAHLWTVTDGEPLAAASWTPPFNIVVAQPRTDDALRLLADELRARAELPGVTGAFPEVDVFADAWGGTRRLAMSQGVYAAGTVREPDVAGTARDAAPADRDLVLEWLRAFEVEALPEDAPHLDLEASFERRVQSTSGGFALWEDERGEPVSLCGYGGRTPHGTRIGPVYTPPALRGRGYGSAVTAHVTKEQLDSGRDYCFLYTDLSNPTSNKIYVDIGYERVCDSAEYSFG